MRTMKKLLQLNFVYIFLLFLMVSVYPQVIKAQAILFYDDFELDRSYQWNIIQGNWIRQYVQGSNRYGLILTTPSSYTGSQAGEFAWTNYEFSFDMLPMQGADRNVFFRVNNQRSTVIPSLNLPVGYGLHMYPNRMWLQKWTATTGVEPVNVPISLPDNVPTHFRIQVVDNRIKVFLREDITPTIDYTDNNNPHLSGKIELSETTGASYPTEVWFDNIVVTSLEPEPQPVLVIPGMGASWNADALLNCEDEGYYGNWELSPFAEDIYNPLLQTLAASEHDVIPYYYDWRKDVSHHTQSLSNLIQSQSTDSYIVGHSMGGLLGRAYLEFTKENSNLDKLITVGSPHQGALLAYPAWSAGEVWSDNLLQRIAMTVAIKRCSGLFGNDRVAVRNHIPSAQNLLPTFNYLFNKNLQQEIAVSSQDAQNNWLPNNDFPSPFYGVQVGTLSGTGFSTLYKLDVKDANKKDLKEGNWMDGDPTKKYHTDLGDGTVRTSSGGLAGALINRVINKNHSDLVKSSEGINEILDFLDISITPLSATSSTPESALIIMSPDAEVKFELTQESSSATGISVILSPTSKNYKINVNTIKDESTIIVAQFLPNDQTLWKEYKVEKGTYKGILKFNRSKIEEDILEWN